MSGEASRAAAGLVARAAGAPVVLPSAVGVVSRVSASGTNGEAQVMFGFSPDLVPVGASNWCSSFVASVAAGAAVGRRVLVVFADTQPIIVETLGIS